MPIEIDDLTHSSEMVAKVAWADVPAAAVGNAMEDLLTARNRQDGALLAMVRSFEVRGEHRAEGHPGMASWLQHHGHLRKREAQRIARLCRFADKLPVCGNELLAGNVNFAHVEVIADAHRERFHEAWVEAAPKLLAYAAEARFEDFARQVLKFADQLDPEGAEDRFREQLEKRFVTKATSLDGFGHLSGWLEPFGYQIFATEHDHLIRDLFEADWAAAKSLLGRDPDPIELAYLTRLPAERAHDALIEMAIRSRARRGGASAMVESLIHIDGDSFVEAVRHLLAEDPDDQPHYPPDGFCETADGSVISPIAAVYLAVLGQIRGIVFDEHGNILSYGRSRRLFTPTQAAAIRAKFRRCTHPYGCDRTGPLLQSDHVVEHQDGGRTDITNLKPECGSHNRWKTNQRGKPPPSDTWRDTGQRRAPPDLGL